MENKTKIIIFCGGSGTRMWPMSRNSSPKQFQPLIGSKTIFRQTIDRLLKICPSNSIFISSNQSYVEVIKKEASEIPEENMIIEPEKRDTFACVGYAVSIINDRFPDSVIFSVWSDHYVRNEEEFVRAVKTAEKIAEHDDVIVNVDAKPTFPNVTLGYMEMGKMIKEVDGFPVYQYIRQIEKPELNKAKEFVRSYRYLWHTGYAVFKSNLMLDLYQKYSPEVYEILKNIIQEGKNTEKVKELYSKIPKASIDLAIYEKIKDGKIVEIPADLGWNDIGAWNVLKDELAENGKALVVKGENYDIGSIDCLIYELTQGKIVATVGCENLIIVDTPDALLVCPKYKSQEVKKIVERLKSEGKNKYL